MVHLGEFMVPFMVTLVLAINLVVGNWKKNSLFSKTILLLVLIPVIADLGIYFITGWQNSGSGSIAASRKRHVEFKASNGVNVKLNAVEFARDTLIRDTVAKYSKPGEFVVCYPYYPMVNFMTARPSYEYNLYADNALPPDRFFAETTAGM